VLISTTPGCRKSGAIPVRGSITYQGQSIANATLTFFPTTGRPVSTSVSDGDYKTELMPGDYTAVVSVALDTPQGYGRTHWNKLPPQKFVLPEEYTTRTKSKLKASVKVDQAEPINFELK